MRNVLTLTPALTITKDEMEQALEILERALTNVEAKPQPTARRD
jgi:4-aminobutyrate aminotransferase-like enzyme